MSQVCFHSFHVFSEQSAKLSGGGGFICGGGGRFIAVVDAEGGFEVATADPGELSSSLIDEIVNTEHPTHAATVYQYAILLNQIVENKKQNYEPQLHSLAHGFYNNATCINGESVT